MLRNLLLISTAAFVFNGCFGSEDEKKWNSFIYPDKTNTKRSLKSPMTFSSLGQCQEESKKQLVTMNLVSIGTFKCGLNCEYHDGMKMEICEKMLIAKED